jgi:hypothetical protein
VIKLTPAERVIVENQKTILHGLRALCWTNKMDNVARDMQDAMSRSHDILNDDARHERMFGAL